MAETQEVELWGIDGSIVLYGVVADILLIVPLLMYLVLDDTNSWAQYHQTYINMLFSAYAPLGISWFIVLADDSTAARTALTGAIEMAGLGPFALLWVGYATFLMSAKSGSALTMVNTAVWVFGIIYPVCNILLLIMHYHLSPPMYAWLAVAPMLENPIDSVKPWADPTAKNIFTDIKDAFDNIEPVKIEPVQIDPIEIEEPVVEVEVAAPEVTIEADADADADFEADADADFEADADVSIDADVSFG